MWNLDLAGVGKWFLRDKIWNRCTWTVPSRQDPTPDCSRGKCWYQEENRLQRAPRVQREIANEGEIFPEFPYELGIQGGIRHEGAQWHQGHSGCLSTSCFCWTFILFKGFLRKKTPAYSVLAMKNCFLWAQALWNLYINGILAFCTPQAASGSMRGLEMLSFVSAPDLSKAKCGWVLIFP